MACQPLFNDPHKDNSVMFEIRYESVTSQLSCGGCQILYQLWRAPGYGSSLADVLQDCCRQQAVRDVSSAYRDIDIFVTVLPNFEPTEMPCCGMLQ